MERCRAFKTNSFSPSPPHHPQTRGQNLPRKYTRFSVVDRHRVLRASLAASYFGPFAFWSADRCSSGHRPENGPRQPAVWSNTRSLRAYGRKCRNGRFSFFFSKLCSCVCRNRRADKKRKRDIY